MIEPRKYTKAQDDGIDAPEVNTREHGMVSVRELPRGL